ARTTSSTAITTSTGLSSFSPKAEWRADRRYADRSSVPSVRRQPLEQPAQIFRSIGLLHEHGARHRRRQRGRRIATGTIDDRQFGAFCARVLRQRRAIHASVEIDVGKQHVHLRPRLEIAQSLLARGYRDRK